MMYLNDITLDDGSFSYVEKSNRWIYDDLQNIFGRVPYQQVVIVIRYNQEPSCISIIKIIKNVT